MLLVDGRHVGVIRGRSSILELDGPHCIGPAPARLLWLGDGAYGVGPADIAGVARIQRIGPADSVFIVR